MVPRMARNSRDRQLLDRRFAEWRRVPAPMPPRGWLRAIREALGMPRAEVARRLDVTDQAVASIEKSEADGSIQLDTLRRAAAALDCTLVYALVPKQSLEAIVDNRAHLVARRDVDRVMHTMLLEDQLGGEDDTERLVDELAERMRESPALWRD